MYRVLSPSELRRMGFIQCVDCKRWLNPDDFLHVREVDLTRHMGGIPHVDQRAR